MGRVVAVRAMLVVRVRGGLDVAAVIVMGDALVIARGMCLGAMRTPARAPLECEEKEPPRVERGHPGGDDGRQESKSRPRTMRNVGRLDDRVLGIETGSEGESRQSERTDR